MMKTIDLIPGLFFITAALLFCNLLKAEEVTTEYNGLTLNANLEMAEGKDYSDGIVLILHGMLAHNRMELVVASQRVLLESDISSLAINLSLGLDNRHGMFDCTWPHRHLQEDALEEIAAWVAWLRNKGVSEITLMAHSRAANQSMVYAAERLDAEVVRLVMLAPGADDVRLLYEERYGPVFDQSVQRMQQLIESGNSEDLVDGIDLWFCPQASVTPASYISYYGPQSKFRQFKRYLPLIPVPALIIAGSEDERQPYIKERVSPFVDNVKIFLVEIVGSGHFFRDLNMDEAMEAMIEFMENTQ